MPIKVTISKSLQRILKGGFPSDVRREFGKRGPLKIKRAIIQDMNKGVSPVKGGGKWAKYSPSYKKTITTSKSFKARSASTKAISPINLRHSGELHKSLKVFTKGGVLRNWRLAVQFKSFLADIHNRLGAGKPKVKRRLLPTRNGEKFNKRITDVMFNELKKAVDVVAKKISGQ